MPAGNQGGFLCAGFPQSPAADLVPVDFAFEAKCYGPTNSVGVLDMSRSRGCTTPERVRAWLRTISG
ncbi:protein of unknown function [Streptomyces sp. KY75]|nr:protein of unknown function [Streptomyces sp. KY75]CAD5983042.1 protein of unknown function [Streptomyces sp. KY70]